MSAASAIEEAFSEYFSSWGLRLPAEAPTAGFIQDEGWLIQYRFAEDDRGAFLDFYASHRMTNDRHVRIRADGSTESLPALCTMMFLPESETERADAEREFNRRNREIAEELVAKGFDRFTINMHLAVNPLDDDST